MLWRVGIDRGWACRGLGDSGRSDQGTKLTRAGRVGELESPGRPMNRWKAQKPAQRGPREAIRPGHIVESVDGFMAMRLERFTSGLPTILA